MSEVSSYKLRIPSGVSRLGLGLRSVHFGYILKNMPSVGWFEIISENFLNPHGMARNVLRKISGKYPIAMHGVSLSIGSADELSIDYLQRLRELADEVSPVWVSDHICWTGVNGINTHDLLPIPFNREMLDHVSRRVEFVQKFLDRPLVLENPSTYMTLTSSTMDEVEFINRLVCNTGCKLLLDINNAFVSGYNNGFDPIDYITRLPLDSVVQVHLAGCEKRDNMFIDTHSCAVRPEVWKILEKTSCLLGDVAILLEWDDKIPDFQTCFEEAKKAELCLGSGGVGGA